MDDTSRRNIEKNTTTLNEHVSEKLSVFPRKISLYLIGNDKMKQRRNSTKSIDFEQNAKIFNAKKGSQTRHAQKSLHAQTILEII